MLLRCSLIAMALAATLVAQWTGSGSTGSDGTLDLATPGTILFDPGTFTPQLNPANDNIFNFTSIYIAKDVTVKLSSQKLSGPVFWLVQGPVVIDGTIDLSGSDGEVRLPSIPGAGGFPGGAASKPGYRPSSFTPNVFLVPLVGGFGGDGGETTGGGAGGGALLIASSTSITIHGSIVADGGSSGGGLGGGGGAIRLVSPLIAGSGLLSAKGGQPQGADGLVRFEALEVEFQGDLNGTPHSQGKPFGLFLPPQQANVRIVSIEQVWDHRAENKGAQTVNVVVEARHMNPGSIVEVQLFMEDGTSQSVKTTPLVGSFDRSRAATWVTLLKGSARGIVRAEWKEPQGGHSSK